MKTLQAVAMTLSMLVLFGCQAKDSVKKVSTPAEKTSI